MPRPQLVNKPTLTRFAQKASPPSSGMEGVLFEIHGNKLKSELYPKICVNHRSSV